MATPTGAADETERGSRPLRQHVTNAGTPGPKGLMTAEQELIWLAGLLEGEGCFSQAHARKSSVLVYLGMTDRDVVESAAAIVQRIVGGRTIVVHPVDKAPNQTQYRMRLIGRRGVRLMREVRPYMHTRRAARIDELLAIHGGDAA